MNDILNIKALCSTNYELILKLKLTFLEQTISHRVSLLLGISEDDINREVSSIKLFWPAVLFEDDASDTLPYSHFLLTLYAVQFTWISLFPPNLSLKSFSLPLKSQALFWTVSVSHSVCSFPLGFAEQIHLTKWSRSRYWQDRNMAKRVVVEEAWSSFLGDRLGAAIKTQEYPRFG